MTTKNPASTSRLNFPQEKRIELQHAAMISCSSDIGLSELLAKISSYGGQ
jgi:hypothetical protein